MTRSRPYTAVSVRPVTMALLQELRALTRDETGEKFPMVLVLHRAVLVALESERAKKAKAGGG